MNKRKVDQIDGIVDSGTDSSNYQNYVQTDNERLRNQLRELKDSFERLRRQKERSDERLKSELELRLKEKRDSENASVEQRLELEKLRKEKLLLENQLKTKDNELSKIKTALSQSTATEDIACDKCDFKTKAEVSLILHTINHKLSHPNQRRLILHPNMFSSRNPNSSYLYMCPMCEGTALTRNEIYPHIYENHTKEKAYKCNECDIFFTHIDYLKLHHKHEHERNKPNRFRSSGYELPKEPLITSIYKPNASRGTQTVLLSGVSGATVLADVPTTSVGNSCSNNGNSGYSYSPQLMSSDMLKCSFPLCSFTTNNRQKLSFHISAHTNSKYKVIFDSSICLSLILNKCFI